jgi:hypothetical protein
MPLLKFKISWFFRIVFTLGCGFTAAVNIDDQKEGFWNRSILAGVRTTEILSALIAIAAVLMTASFISLSTALFLSDIKFNGSLLLLSIFFFLLSWCGMMLGLCFGAVCGSQSLSTSIQLCLTNILNFLIGRISCFD